MNEPPLSKNVRKMTIKKLYTNLYTFVDNLTKIRIVDKRLRDYWCCKEVQTHNIKFQEGYQQADKKFS